MALTADYNIYRNDPGMGALIHTGANVIYGVGSLELSRVSAGSQICCIRKNDPRKFASGRARFLISRANGAAGDNPGIVFNLSQEDVTGGAGTGYLFCLNRPGASLQPSLYNLTAGLGTKALLASGGLLSLPTPPQSYPVQIEWRVDVENLGGVQILCRVGALANYLGTTLNWNTLTPTLSFSYLHQTGYHTTTLGEGPALETAGAGGLYYIDELTVVPLLVGGITT